MASIQVFRQQIVDRAYLAVHGPQCKLLSQTPGYVSTDALPNMERTVSHHSTDQLAWRFAKDVDQVLPADSPVGERFGMQPGQLITQVGVWPAFVDFGTDSNLRNIICNVNVKVLRALHGEDDESLYLHDEMLTSREQLLRHDTWTDLAAVGELTVKPLSEDEPVRQNDIISYSVPFQARVVA